MGSIPPFCTAAVSSSPSSALWTAFRPAAVLVRVALQLSAQAKKNSFHKLQSKMVELESQILTEELKDIQSHHNNKPGRTRRAGLIATELSK